MTTADNVATHESELDPAQALMDRGDWPAAIDLMSQANRQRPDPRLEERLVEARHSAFATTDRRARDDAWPPREPDRFAGVEGLPEVDGPDLDAASLRAAMQHHGALVVRGLLDRETAGTLLDDVTAAFAASEAADDGASPADTTPWYVPFRADEKYSFGALEQYAARAGGGVLLAESPRLLFRVVDAYKAVGLDDTIADYLGERPALSVQKSTLRRASATSGRGWHQDGRFLGAGVHTINVWTALTPCGIYAPSVDVFALPIDHIVETGTDGADHPWSVGRDVAASYGLEHVVRPAFSPGDAMLFNQMTLHETGISAEMNAVRYAIESWFFGPSTYPVDQVPLVF